VVAWAALLAWLGTAGASRAEAGQPVAADHGDVSPAMQSAQVVLDYFGREACPYCRHAELWLEPMQTRHPELLVRATDVDEPTGRDRFITMMRERGETPSAVPTFILTSRDEGGDLSTDAVWVGFSEAIAAQIEADVSARLSGQAPPTRPAGELDLGWLGTVDLGAQPMLVATLLIAFVDGFNPCSLWVLTVLLAMILATRSRARIAAVGLTFLAVTTLIYGLFIVGLFSALVVMSSLGWIQLAVGLLAIAFGAINVKDFFAYKKGLSFTIPDRFKPAIYRGGRAIRRDRPLAVTLAITIALASGVALVELPCTAGFPVLWTAMLSDAGLGHGGFAALLAVYLLVYLSVEIAILVGALVTMRVTRMQERHGKTLKLFGGAVMIALGLVLWIDRSIMERPAAALGVLLVAVAASLLVLLATRAKERRTRGPRHRASPARGRRRNTEDPCE
jgi:cytochrome c biogenesis protein CcdA